MRLKSGNFSVAHPKPPSGNRTRCPGREQNGPRLPPPYPPAPLVVSAQPPLFRSQGYVIDGDQLERGDVFLLGRKAGGKCSPVRHPPLRSPRRRCRLHPAGEGPCPANGNQGIQRTILGRQWRRRARLPPCPSQRRPRYSSRLYACPAMPLPLPQRSASIPAPAALIRRAWPR